MKRHKHSFHSVALLIFLNVLASCAQETNNHEQSVFQKMCLGHNHQWMSMSETKNGMIVGPACDGCMPDPTNHLCSQQEYEEHIKK